ncbi:hypothetical protein BaRGS_00011527, partial [Batillaria attramentaria]
HEVPFKAPDDHIEEQREYSACFGCLDDASRWPHLVVLERTSSCLCLSLVVCSSRCLRNRRKP